jgi:acetyl/propionyl-CoA carboxylase alpha subunit
VTGLDLVRAQLLVAAGTPLPWTQDSISQRGHAIEARVYAEDPAEGFLPQAGRLLLYREPRSPGIRVDSGAVEGGNVSIYYDAMIAKVIATAENRDRAIARLGSALRDFPILGVRTNIPFLLRILDHARFRAGTMDTAFLDRDGAALAGGAPDMPSHVRAAIEAAERDRRQTTGGSAPSAGGAGRRQTDPWTAIHRWGRE